MKTKLFLLLLLVSVAVVSCNKDKSNDTQSTASSSLPTKATTYIDNNYPDATIETVVKLTSSNATYLVTLNTAEELAFDKAGGYLGFGSEFHHGQPTCDTIYGGHHGGGHHGGGHHGGGHHGGDHHGGIPVDSLSTTITGYIATNYPDYQIMHAENGNICPDGNVIEVMIVKPQEQPLRLIFGAEDAFLMTSAGVPYENVPQAVKDYITANYADFMTGPIADELTLTDNSIQYLVHLRQAELNKQVRIAEDGTFICEQ